MISIAIDASSVAYHANYATPEKALLALTSYVLSPPLPVEPRFVFVCFDGMFSKHERRQLYPQYKAQRETDNPLSISTKAVLENFLMVCHHLPCVVAHHPFCEADDWIGFIASQGKGKVYILSKDRDFYQLTNDNVKLFEVRGQQIWLPFPPEDALAMKVLVGDRSDNIKGVLGVGEKTAAQLLAAHKNLDGVLAYAKEQGTLGRMPYVEVLETVERNLVLCDLKNHHQITPERAEELREATRTRPKAPDYKELSKILNVSERLLPSLLIAYR